MTFSGLHLHYAKKDIDAFLPAHLQKIKLLKKGQWLFTFKGKEKFHIYLSIHSQDARMHRTNQVFDYSEALDNFSIRMKKWLLNSTLVEIKQPGIDRTLTWTFKGKDALFNPKTYYFMTEFFGKDANVIMTDDRLIIFDLYKTSGSLNENQRLLQIGAPYEYLENFKLNPFDEAEVKTYLSDSTRAPVYHVFNGFSKEVASDFIETVHNVKDWMNRLNHPKFSVSNGRHFLFKDTLNPLTFIDFADALLGQTHIQRPYDGTKSKALKALEKRLKKATKKDALLSEQLIQTKESSWYSNIGNLIMQYEHKHQKMASVEVFDYLENTLRPIPLNPKYTVLENANLWFKKAKKMKASIPHLKKQIAINQEDIAYFELLITQIIEADEMSIQDIYLELIQEKIIQVKSSSLVKKKAKYKTFISSDHSEIYVGMNNFQNNELTHKIAKNTDWFCHVKDYPGSHVIIKDPSPSLKTIEEACMLAAYYSKAKDSPKVEVDVTLIKYVKKIPGKYGCFVRYDHQDAYTVEAKKPDILEK